MKEHRAACFSRVVCFGNKQRAPSYISERKRDRASNTGSNPLIDGELVAQSEVVNGELAVVAAEKWEESKQVEQKGDHRTRIVSGSEPTDQPLGCRTGFWRRTASRDCRTGPVPAGHRRSRPGSGRRSWR